MPEPTKTTPAGKGVRTAIQAIGGALVGLAAAVWVVPGVPEAVTSYLIENAVPLLLAVGIPAGLIAFLQNKVEKK